MHQYVTFVLNHWELFAALVVILALLAGGQYTDRLRGFRAVSPAEATQLINREDALVLDVRDDGEYQGGHIINSVHIPLTGLSDRLGELEKHKDKPIIVGCRSGQRSARACSTLRKQGFERVYNLAGGVMAWQNANLPLSKK